jgi:hypothetical protein
MGIKVRDFLTDEFSKLARHTSGYLHERAAELEKNMSTVMDESGKGSAMKFGEGTMLGSFAGMKSKSKRAAFVPLVRELMSSRMLKSGGAGPFAGTAPETKSGETS